MHIMVIRPLRLFGAQEGFYGKPLPTLILSHLQLDGKIEQGKKKKDREHEKVTEREWKGERNGMKEKDKVEKKR